MSFNYLPKRVSSYYNFELLIKLQINNLMLWIKRLTIIIITTENYENLFISIDLQYNSVIKHQYCQLVLYIFGYILTVLISPNVINFHVRVNILCVTNNFFFHFACNFYFYKFNKYCIDVLIVLLIKILHVLFLYNF